MLIELAGRGDGPALTGGVEHGGPGPIVVNLGASPRLPQRQWDVVASFFTPEALYVARSTATALDDDCIIELDVREWAVVQRRAAPRVQRHFPVALGAFAEDDYISVAGETTDLAPGGCRVVCDEHLPHEGEATICIQVAGEPVVAHARVLEDRPDGGRWEYRLMFDEIEEPDRRRLALVLAG